MSTRVSTIAAKRAARRFRPEDYLDRLPSPAAIGVVSAVILAIGSHGAGATRNRGGLLEALNLSFLAFGHGAAVMNALVSAGLIGMVLAWVVIGRRVIVDKQYSTPLRLQHIQRALVLWCVPLLAAAPILSRDVYSYLMQGAMVRDGFDPYSEGAAVNPGPFLLEVSHDWRNTTTPYGPLHLWIGEGVTKLVGENVSAGVIAYKLISVLGFFAIAWAVPKIAARLGGDPALALWLGVANPVMVFHMVGGMHNESIMVGLVSVGLLAAVYHRYVSAVALIAVAVSLKATAAIALPFVVWMVTYRYAPHMRPFGRRALAFVVSGALALIETVAVVWLVTWASGSSWGWLSEITGNSKVINPLAAPTLLTELITPFIQLFDPTFEYNVVLQALRPIFSVLMLLGLVACWWFFRGGGKHALAGTAAAYQTAFVLSSVTLPWYYASVISLLGTFRPPLWLCKLGVGASIVVALAFSGSGNHQLYNVPWMAGVIIAAWLLTVYVFPLDAENRPGLAGQRRED
ncbi:alpha-(1-_6)-mannopyranosyltransferase A [Corynebacterium tapiri]|nr:alpha-(1->6)-mannopyranosyltransferase A [Corynebacterium tapiri]